MAKDPLKEMQRLADLVGEGKISVAEYEQRKAALFGDEVPSSRVPSSEEQALTHSSNAPKRALMVTAFLAVAIVGIGVAIFIAVAEDSGLVGDSSPVGGSMELGSDPNLDLLYDGCLAGASSDCDMMYFSSPLDSAYEYESLICGGRTGLRDPFESTCMTAENSLDELAAVRVQCESGFYAACDLLYFVSPIGSADERLGASCAGLKDVDETDTCVITFGYGSR